MAIPLAGNHYHAPMNFFIEDAFESAPLLAAVYANESEKVKSLLASKCDIFAKDTNGNTALHIACQNGRKKIVGLLVDEPETIRQKNNFGETPLHTMKASSDIPEIAEIMLKINKKVLTDRDQIGLTPFHSQIVNMASKTVLHSLCYLENYYRSKDKDKENEIRPALESQTLPSTIIDIILQYKNRSIPDRLAKYVNTVDQSEQTLLECSFSKKVPKELMKKLLNCGADPLDPAYEKLKKFITKRKQSSKLSLQQGVSELSIGKQGSKKLRKET